jgi:uncharacterized membrane protein YccC
MEMVEGFIFNAGWFFFAVWSVVLAAVGIITFGRDMLKLSSANIAKKMLRKMR